MLLHCSFWLKSIFGNKKLNKPEERQKNHFVFPRKIMRLHYVMPLMCCLRASQNMKIKHSAHSAIIELLPV
ncbi:hypothetical protein SE17_06640 [Kouleothrix aurantiaca]|uniref:Uncharacterized protein n=1 Tax=Kouleothrix aurantiaca TaxID=186479 RepID=A0A0P9DV23_9CHLR|nr:hypothetical protein SE17_06640 [Kouleothrix aurantiaca]